MRLGWSSVRVAGYSPLPNIGTYKTPHLLSQFPPNPTPN